MKFAVCISVVAADLALVIPSVDGFCSAAAEATLCKILRGLPQNFGNFVFWCAIDPAEPPS